MDDSSEDDQITLADHGNQFGSVIHTINQTSSGPYVGFEDVNVTAQLRRDLFGAGTGQDTTGFVFLTTNAIGDDFVDFNVDNAEIVITVYPDGGVPDAAADTDVDTDSDTDGDTSSSDGGCGCNAAGTSVGGSLFASIFSLILGL